MQRRTHRLAGLAVAATLAAVAAPVAAAPEVARAELEVARIHHVVSGFDIAVAGTLAPTAAPGVALDRLLARLDADWSVAGDAANLLLDDALVDADQLSPGSRVTTRARVTGFIAEAEAALARAITRHADELDPHRAALDRLEIAEYLVTCERLREVDALLQR